MDGKLKKIENQYVLSLDNLIYKNDKLSIKNCEEISLQQTEFDVVIEMECPECQSWGYISECRNNCNKKFLQPKLDKEGFLILKRK